MSNNCILLPGSLGNFASDDPYIDNVVLLMRMEGANNGSIITDAKGHIVTNNNVVTSTERFATGTSSAKFNGTMNHNLVVPRSGDFDFDSGAFTIEFQANLLSVPDQAACPISMRNGAGTDGFLFYGSATSLTFYVSNTAVMTGTVNWNDGAMHHIAVTRNGNTWRMFQDGQQIATVDAAYTINPSSSDLVFGQNNANVRNYFHGYLDDVRFTKGVSRYNGNFAPSQIVY